MSNEVEGYLIFNPDSKQYTFRVYNKDHSYTDYELKAYDIKMKLIDGYVDLQVDEQGKHCLDYVHRKPKQNGNSL